MDATNGRANRRWWLLFPYSLAAFALALFTIGQAVGPPGEAVVSGAVVGLSVLFIVVLPQVRVRDELAGRLAILLIAGGVLSAVVAGGMLWYSGTVADRLTKLPGRAVLSVPWPTSPAVVSYLCLLFGTGLVACGLRVAMPRRG